MAVKYGKTKKEAQHSVAPLSLSRFEVYNVVMLKKRGFTLIELLIVIAIIGILSTVVMAALNSARLKARNATRISQLRQINTALEMYYNDYGVYPSTGGIGVYRTDCQSGHQNDPNNIIPGLVPTYIPSISSDPTHIYTAVPLVNQSCLGYESDGKDYAVYLYLMKDPSPGFATFDYSVYPSLTDPRADGGTVGEYCLVQSINVTRWKMYSPGACSWGW